MLPGTFQSLDDLSKAMVKDLIAEGLYEKETLTPEMESRIAQLLGQLSAADCGAREEATRQLKWMGRFAEPALQRVSREVNNEEVRSQAETILAMLRAED